jgi:hypothetical protein
VKKLPQAPFLIFKFYFFNQKKKKKVYKEIHQRKKEHNQLQGRCTRPAPNIYNLEFISSINYKMEEEGALPNSLAIERNM